MAAAAWIGYRKIQRLSIMPRDRVGGASTVCHAEACLVWTPSVYQEAAVNFAIETEPEDDGRWLAEIPALPGVMAYGQTRQEAVSRVQVLALRVLADRLENGEPVPDTAGLFSVSP